MFADTTSPRRAPLAGTVTLATRLRGGMEALLRRWAAAEDRRRNARRMSDLPDHLLHDIGVTRDEMLRELRRARRF